MDAVRIPPRVDAEPDKLMTRLSEPTICPLPQHHFDSRVAIFAQLHPLDVRVVEHAHAHRLALRRAVVLVHRKAAILSGIFPRLSGEAALHVRVVDRGQERAALRVVDPAVPGFSVQPTREFLGFCIECHGETLPGGIEHTAGTESAPNDSRGAIKMGDFAILIQPLAEWHQMYAETWRVRRDFFYDRGPHDLDLAATRARYEPYPDASTSGADLDHLLFPGV